MSNNKSGKKPVKYIIFLLVLIVFAVTFLFNLFSCNRNAEVKEKTMNESIAALTAFDYSKVTTVESEIERLELTEGKTTFDATKPLTSAEYIKIFKGNIIIGDSVTEGLIAYEYLTDEIVYSKIGASLLNGDELFQAAAEANPLRVIFAFGINDMLNYNGECAPFIKRYKQVINEFRKNSPKTKIYINSITVPGPDALEAKPSLANYKEFNRQLQALCKEMKVGFIDNTKIFKDNPDIYAGDGIHVISDYYPMWMNNIIRKAGL